MKFRVRSIVAGKIRWTRIIEAESFEATEAEARALDAMLARKVDHYLVEIIAKCEGCGKEMPQPDPRTARYPDGSPVYPDPLRAYDGICCLDCGRKLREIARKTS